MKTIRHLSWILFLCVRCFPAAGQNDFLNSDPAAKAVAYLDFNGAVVRGSIWNISLPEINAKPSALDPLTIKTIQAAVANYFKLFNVNISTDPTAYDRAPVNQRIHIIVTPDGDWYGHAAGASITGSFTWGDDTPGWVFTDRLGGSPHYIAATIAHEIGHTLGLQHQALYNTYNQLITETSGGEDHPLDDTAPLMGVPYYKTAGWTRGHTPEGAAIIQNDTMQIAGAPNNLGYRSTTPIPTMQQTAKAIRASGQNAEGLWVESSGSYQYRLFDMSGRLLRQGRLQPGANAIESDLTTGVLLLQWYNGNSGGTEKIIR